MVRRKPRILMVLSWIHTVLFIQSIYVAGSCFLAEKKGKLEQVMLAAVFEICIIITYVSVRRIKQLWLFVIAAVLLAAGVNLITEDVLATTLVIGICVGRMLVKLRQGSIRKKMQELPGMAGAMEEKEFQEAPDILDVPRVSSFLVWIMLYVAAALLKNVAAVKTIFALLAVEVLVCFAYHYIDRMLDFMSKNRHVANVPIKMMQKIAMGMVGIGILLLAIGIVPAAIYQKEPLANLDIKLEEQIFDRYVQEEVYEKPIEAEGVMETIEHLRGNVKETPQWLLNVSKAAAFLFVLGIIAVLFWTVMRAVRKAMGDFSEEEADEIIFLREGSEELPGQKKRAKKERGARNSPEQKIRRAYKKMVRRELKETLTGCETPSEIERKAGIKEPDCENASDAHELYEKARYNKLGSMKEEAKKYMHIFTRTDR